MESKGNILINRCGYNWKNFITLKIWKSSNAKVGCHCKGSRDQFGCLVKFIRCNCLLGCHYVKNEDFKFSGKDFKSLSIQTNVARHYFAPVWNLTHNHPRINPAMTAFNVGCLDGIDTFKIKDVVLADGQNHPLDKK